MYLLTLLTRVVVHVFADFIEPIVVVHVFADFIEPRCGTCIC